MMSMKLDGENKEPLQNETDSSIASGTERREPLNEQSELSLEERMNAADQLGVPGEGVIDTDATNAMDGGVGLQERKHEQSLGERQ